MVGKVEETGNSRNRDDPVAEERLVYVRPGESAVVIVDDELEVRQFLAIVWSYKFFIVLIVLLFFIASIGYALLATHWYRAEVLLAPAESKSGGALGGQLGGLVALAGGNLNAADTAEAVAVLKSRELAREFVIQRDLLPLFFQDKWDEENNEWLVDNQEDWPDTRDAVRYFHKNVLTVSTDRQSSLVTMSVDWKDPDTAAEWAADLVQRVNIRMRERALREAESNIEYLKQELSASGVVTLQQSIGRLLESEMQKFMLARGNEEFAFRVVDAAVPPKYPIRPKRALIVFVGTVLGGVLAVMGALVRHVIRDS